MGLAPPPSGIRIVEVPVENFEDQEFKARWIDTKLWCSSLYYPDASQRWPEMLVNALRAIADAKSGILIHCQAGRDRTGLVCALLLASVGVTPEAIVADYLESFRHMSETERQGLDAALLRRKASLADGLEVLLATAEPWNQLEAHGLNDELRAKLCRCLRGEGSQRSKR